MRGRYAKNIREICKRPNRLCCKKKSRKLQELKDEIDNFYNSKCRIKVSNELIEILHYASCIDAGFNLDYNDFTIQEQILIIYARDKKINSIKTEEIEWWAKFFNKGFNSLGSGLKAIGKLIAKKGI